MEALRGAPRRETQSEVMRRYGITPVEVNEAVKKFFGVDDNFVCEVVLYIASKRAMVDPEWESGLSVVMRKTGVTAEQVRQAARQRRQEFAGETETQLPGLKYSSDFGARTLDMRIQNIATCGGSLLAAGMYPEAEVILQYALSLVILIPQENLRSRIESDCSHSLSILYIQTKQYAEADRYFHLFMRDGHEFGPMNWYTKGMLSLRVGKIVEAENALLRALAKLDERQLQPETAPFALADPAGDMRCRIETLILLSMVYSKTNYADKAKGVLDLAEVLAGQNGNLCSLQIRRAFGHLELSKGHFAKAKSLFEQCIIELQPYLSNSRFADLIAELHADIASCDT